MKNPRATYRVQLSPEFPFEDLEKVLDYLGELGISTIYSAPVFQARKGSTHGYDVVDPLSLNKEIGRLEKFREIARKLKGLQMNWLQDIVPNHMAFDSDNLWLRDIFERGPKSGFFNSFDIDWEGQSGQKVMAPFLGGPIGEVLERQEISLELREDGIFLTYFDHSYPVSKRTYQALFDTGELPQWGNRFSTSTEENPENWEEVKHFFLRQVSQQSSLERAVKKIISSVNESREKLEGILELQYFKPVYWKQTEQSINYRRFFTINDLICLRMEDREVFDSYHRFILQLCKEDLIQGLRIDHIDGLFDPQQYLEWLRENLGPEFYVIIEKILEWDEKLPAHWPVQGTSGYGFLAAVNQVLTCQEHQQLFEEEYARIAAPVAQYQDLVYHQKRFILHERMGGEYNNLWQLALDLNLVRNEEGRREALGNFLAAFPVYRIYPETFPLNQKQKEILTVAHEQARQHNPDLKPDLDHWYQVFLGQAEGSSDNMLFFLKRCQQFTGPLAAKGVEDTSFYLHNKLISHNEVGDSPGHFGIAPDLFHRKMQKRASDFPLSINATATHDTKRGEDARMRINVLSELGQEWFQKVREWEQILSIPADAVPDANERYFIYQMLVGAWPFQDKPGKYFLKRTEAYLKKVLREGKQHSSWAEPDKTYEKTVMQFVESLLENQEFLKSFQSFHQQIRPWGALKSLSQTMLKLTCPGIPDIYQGTELWDLSYVDPDNRRPVDYNLRKRLLQTFTNPSPEMLKDLKMDFHTGSIKLFCLHRVLQFRQKFPELFESGDYEPLKISGTFAEDFLAFSRRQENRLALVVVPLMVRKHFDQQLDWLPEDSPEIELGQQFPEEWQNVMSGTKLTGRIINIREVLGEFPVGLLTNQDYEDR